MPIPSYIPAAGITPASAFYPQTFDPLGLPAAYLADEIAASNTKYESGVEVQAGDIVSITDGWDPIDSQVVAAIQAELNSGTALGKTGNRFNTIKKNDDTTASALKFQVESALKRLVQNRDIEIVSIEAETEDYLGGFVLQYKNLRSGDEGAKAVRTVPLSIS